MNIIDLHVHSCRSDGSYTPTELVDYAIEKGLTAFALTDHDTIDGIDEALAEACRLAALGRHIEVIPGIEFSTEYNGSDIHIVGLDIDYHTPTFTKQLKAFVDSRIVRNIKMCNNLQEAGIDITYEKLKKAYPDAVITRAHYAKYLLAHGYVTSLQEAFTRYVGDHTKYFVPREKVTPMQAVELILSAGGIPVLAHPILYGLGKKALDTLVSTLTDAGLIGIEAIYSTYNQADERQIRELAVKYNLCISGGSDFHGTAKPDIDLAVGRGHLFIPDEVLIKMRQRKRSTDSNN